MFEIENPLGRVKRGLVNYNRIRYEVFEMAYDIEHQQIPTLFNEMMKLFEFYSSLYVLLYLGKSFLYRQKHEAYSTLMAIGLLIGYNEH